MRAVIAATGWPQNSTIAHDMGGPQEVAWAVAEAWEDAAPHADVAALAYPDGGPRTADALGGLPVEMAPAAVPRFGGNVVNAVGVLRSVVKGRGVKGGGAMRSGVPGGGVVGVAVVGPSLAGLGGAGFGGPGSTIAASTRSRVVLAPQADAWDPVALRAALEWWAGEAGREGTTLTIPVGDLPAAGDPLDLWGGDLAAARAACGGATVEVVVTSQRPLLGFNGMSAARVSGGEPARAGTAAAASQEEERRWAAVAREADALASRRTLLGPARLSDQAGTGAAGGLAYALAALGATVVPAVRVVPALTGLDRGAALADVVVAVVSRLDTADLDHGTAAAAAATAAAAGVPCVVVAGEIAVGKRDLMAGGVAGAHEAGGDSVPELIRRVAHTWTPARDGQR